MKDLEGTRESLRLVGGGEIPMFQDMYDGQDAAGMVAREQHANQVAGSKVTCCFS